MKAGIYVDYDINSGDLIANTLVENLKNSRVDLILMDIQMPMLDGYETAQIIRKEYSKEKPIPIIAMTAYTFAKKLI